MACDPTLDRMSLKIRLRADRLWVSDSRCRPPHAGSLPERVLGAHTIVFPRSGVFVRHRAGDRDVGDPNHVIFFNPDEPYRSTHPGGQGDDCDVVTIRGETLREVVGKWDSAVASRGDRVFAFGSHTTSPRVALLQRIIFAGLSTAAGAAEGAEGAVLAVIERVLEEAYRSRPVRALFLSQTTRQHEAWAESVMSMLASQFRRGPSLAEVSDAAGCSPFHLCRVFKRCTGVSIHRYLNSLRLRSSLDDVLDAGTHLADLADTLGYSSHSHFTDAFRREFGVTPTAVRRVGRAVPLRDLAALLGADEALSAAFARLTAPPPAPAAQPEPVPVAAADEPSADHYAFRGDPLDPRPHALPRVPLQPHAA